jgi:hypothetical protein
MKTHYTVTLAMLAGFGLGAVAVQGLHAQAKPPVYYIAEIEPTNLDAYMKDYASLAQKTIRDGGGESLPAGQRNRLKGTRPRHASSYRYGTALKRYRPGAIQQNIRRPARSVTSWPNSGPSRSMECRNRLRYAFGWRPLRNRKQ